MPDAIDLAGFSAQVSAIADRLRALQDGASGSVDGRAVDEALVELRATVEELRIRHEELLTRNEALAESRYALEQEHDRYRSLFELAPVAYLLTDDRGVVLDANRIAIELLNVDERFLRSKPLATFVVPAHRPGFRQQIATVSEKGGPEVAEWDLCPRRRPPVPAEFTLTHFRSPERPDTLLWLIQDLTTEKSLRSRAAQLTAELRRSGADGSGPGDAAVEHALRELGGVLLDEIGLEEILELVAGTALALLPGAAGAGVSLFEQGRPRVAGVSARWVQAVDEAQFGLQEGPCVSALEEGTWRASENLDEESRWPRFASEAKAQGVLAALAVPLLARAARLGVLNVYSNSRNAFDDGAIEVAERLADRASVLIANAQLLAASRRLADELEQALASRATVDMAKGMLMARLGVDPDGAFDALRDLSQRRHVKLRELASELVKSVSEPHNPTGGPSTRSKAGER